MIDVWNTLNLGYDRFVSVPTRRYALGFDRTWSVRRHLPASQRYTYAAEWIGGTMYEYGEEPPRYPMPVIPTHVTWDYCYAMGEKTKMHVLLWRQRSDGTWYGVKEYH